VNIKKAYAIFFSPTGTTEKAVTAVTEGTGLPSEKIDLTPLNKRQSFKQAFTKNELVIAGLPVYGGRLPFNLDDFFSGLKGYNTPAVAMVMYGNREYEDALIELKMRLEKRGFKVIAGAALIGEHTFSRKIATGRPDAGDLLVAKEFGRRIVGIDVERSPRLVVKGNYPFVVKGFDPTQPGPLTTFANITTTGDCTRCGICAEECPWGAIDAEKYTTETTKCMRCFRCIKYCPSSARKVIDKKFYEFLPQFEMRLNAQRREPELFFAP
jgi:ferredoxin/flavodoxin